MVKRGIRLNRRLICLVRADQLFHPDHVVPAAEFISAAVKRPDRGISQMRMELRAVFGQVFVLGFGIGDAGVQIPDSHIPQRILERLIQHSPDAGFLRISTDQS